jgi:general secretion pathway protein K
MCTRPIIPASSERGFVLVAVLWILMALSALTVIFSLYLSNSAQALAVNDSGQQLEALVSAGVELTAYRLLSADEKERPARGEFNFGLNGANVIVSFSSESSRIDLNYASKDTLASLFAVLGANENTAKEYADRVVGWRTRPTPGSSNDEAALYSAAGLTYSPRQGLFAHVNELGLVLGIPPAFVERALPFVTIFNGSSDVDVTIAAPEVVAAQSDGNPTSINTMANSSSSANNSSSSSGALGNEAGTSKPGATSPKSGAFRASIQIKLRDRRRLTSEVVFAVGQDDVPYRVLSWQDELTSGQRQQRRARLQ